MEQGNSPATNSPVTSGPVTSRPATNGSTVTPVNQDHSWQLRLLPVMTGLVLTLALFFFAATMHQLYQLNSKIQQVPQLDNSELLASSNTSVTLVEKQWRSLVLLESHVLQQRYHQANVLLMARVWVRYLGFVTGMILALIGAVFILGKLREPTTELSLGSGSSEPANQPGNLKVQLLTQSPGIVLVTLGTVLMLITIMVHHPIEVADAPIYTSVTMTGAPLTESSRPAQLNLDSASTRKPASADQMSRLLEEARLRHGVDADSGEGAQ